MEYTDFLQLVLSRQSDRAYDKDRPVEAEKLERILEAGRLAPSACNAQPWKFVVITDRELALKVGKAAAGLGMNKFAKDAPVHILIVEESANITSLLGGKVKDKHFPLIDIGIAAAHITLAAESEGLGLKLRSPRKTWPRSSSCGPASLLPNVCYWMLRSDIR